MYSKQKKYGKMTLIIYDSKIKFLFNQHLQLLVFYSGTFDFKLI